jgi:endonuclease/exonuclease/phosphatase family metal-dependent hydrolase
MSSSKENVPWTSSSDINWVKSLSTNNEDFLSGHQGEDNKQVSILSWNILAQHLFDNTKRWYQHISPDAPVSWPERSIKIIDELSQTGADIICLQEVEHEAFRYDLLPALKKIGYEGMMQHSRRQRSGHGYGVATFWKKGRFTLEEACHRSRTMIITLKDHTDGLTLGTINCHLEGNPVKSVTRVKQLQKALSELSTKFTHHDLILCGDMNCQLGSSASSTYLETGTSLTGGQIMDWGQEVDFSHVPSHKYTFNSVFPIDLIKKDPTEYITFVSNPYHYTVGLDQIWVHDTLNAVNVRSHPSKQVDQV